MKARFSLLVLVLSFVAIAARGDDSLAPSASLDTIKKLAGDWVAVGENGQPTDQVVSSIRVTAGGSAVIEILFPGTDHEMVTMYTQDGPDVVLTHYCVLGNQPRMRSSKGTDATKLVFLFDGPKELETANHMNAGTLTIVDENHLKSEWTRCEDGKACETHAFDMVRKAKP